MRKPTLHDRALKAHRLALKNITGEELAARLKCDVETAIGLAQVGEMIAGAEDMRLTEREFNGLTVICRVIARNIMLNVGYAKASDVDFAAGKRSGWTGKVMLGLVASGLVVMPLPGRIALTRAGWALAWETGRIKRNWKVPA